jgi:NADH-quinone oxidoreductase subunit N
VTGRDLVALLPLIVTGYGAVALLVIGAFWRNHTAASVLCLAVFAIAFASILAALPAAPRQVTALLRIDTFSLAYMGLFLLGGAAVAVFSHDYLRQSGTGTEKYYALLLLAVLGTLALAASSHFVSFFIGLETLSVSLYGLIGYSVRRPTSLEAGLKYLVLAGAALAFLLFGMALVYSEFGTMEFGLLQGRLWSDTGSFPSPVPLGIGLIIVGFGFKLAAVPFHTWAPDVYQGGPAPTSALVATVSKAAMFALLIRFAQVIALQDRASLFLLMEVIAIITMFGGNLLALLQRNIKRLIAYSSIAHMGYLLIPLLAGGAEGISSIAFYFVSYFVTTIGAFGVISVLSSGGVEVEELEDYRGLGLRRPWLGAVLALMMLSLAGIPLTIGFIAKFYIFAAAAHSRLWLLLIIGVINSGLAAYYYLRVLAALYLRPAREGATWLPARPASAMGLTVLTILLVTFGVYPSPLISLAQRVSTAAFGMP